MPPLMVVEEVVGTVDGVNDTFTTTHVYTPGSVFPILRGIIREPQGDDGVVELGSNSIQLKTPPETGDVVMALYRTTI